MKHICLNPQCKKEYDGRKNKLYCSDKCRDRQRFLRRKDNPKYIRLRKKIYKNYYQKNGKQNKRIYQKTKKFRNYQNKWRRERKYHLNQYENNPELHREKSRRYRKTDKGKLTTLKCNERRRKKNILLSGRYLDKLNPDFLKIIRERDKVCVYCKEPFDETVHRKKETIDHLNCNEPLSLDNALRCCWSCNSSKRTTPLNKLSEWIKRKKFTPSPIVFELLSQLPTNELVGL